MQNKNITVAQLLPKLNSGGVERGTLEIADSLVKNNFKSIVISGGGILVENLIKNGTEHISLNIGRKSFFILFYIPTLIYLFYKKKIDIVHARSRLPAWIAYLSMQFIPVKKRPFFVTTIHGFNSVSFYSSIMTKGDRIIIVSESLKKFILNNYQIDKKKISVIHRGIPSNFAIKKDLNYKNWINNWNNTYNKSGDKKFLTISCRIARNKGIELFIQLIEKLKNKKVNVIGLIVGEVKSEKYFKSLQKIIDEKNLNEKIHFTGFRSDIYNVMSISAIVYSLSTKPEAFGRTVIESLKIGTPVIGFNYGGVGEQLKELFPQGLVKMNNIEELESKTIKFLHKKQKVNEFKSFSLEKMKKNTLGVYKSFFK